MGEGKQQLPRLLVSDGNWGADGIGHLQIDLCRSSDLGHTLASAELGARGRRLQHHAKPGVPEGLALTPAVGDIRVAAADGVHSER